MAPKWRNQKNEKGLARICQGPRGFELWENGVRLASVSPKTPGINNRTITGWYWYGFGGCNTSSQPVATAEEAKAQVMAYYKTHRA